MRAMTTFVIVVVRQTMKHKPIWTVSEAKTKFSQVVEHAHWIPQTITRDGGPAASEEWEGRTQRATNLADFLSASPLRGSGPMVDRNMSEVRWLVLVAHDRANFVRHSGGRGMLIIVEMHFGSHLYGTTTPLSDLDYKGVYIPDAREILLQRVRRSVSQSLPKALGKKNSAGDVDRELYSLQRFLELLAEGQTVALDMLFAPDAVMLRQPEPVWREIQSNSYRLVTRRAASFVRYCRQQANKYGIKGSRVAAARGALAMLVSAETRHGGAAKLGAAEAEMSAFAIGAEHASLLDMEMPGGRLVRHLEVCGRRMPFTSSIKSARELAQHLVDEYGERALRAERNEGIDWKALSHAVRVGREALELLETGKITFPLPYAAEIMAIKQGDRPYATVGEEIDRLLEVVEVAASRSVLRDEPDQDFIDDLVARAYRASVLEAG